LTTTRPPYIITIGIEYKVLGLYIPKNRGKASLTRRNATAARAHGVGQLGKPRRYYCSRTCGGLT
jgi:hypothetical protein